MAQALIIEADANAALTAAENTLREDQAVWEAFNRRQGDAQRQSRSSAPGSSIWNASWPKANDGRNGCGTSTDQLAEPISMANAPTARWNRRSPKRLRHNQELWPRSKRSRLRREALRRSRASRAVAAGADADRARATRLAANPAGSGLGRHRTRFERLAARDQELAQAPRLAEQLEVEPGWEIAVETVLADWLDAVCVPDLDAVARAGAEFGNGRLTLLEPAAAPEAGAPGSTLAGKVRAPWPLADLLGKVDVAADLAEMLARRAELADGATVVTPDGVRCGRRWLRLARGADESVLRREREIRQLEASLSEDEATLGRQAMAAEQLRSRLHDELERQRRESQQTVNQRHRDHARAQGELNALQARQEHARERRAALEEERAELEQQGERDREQVYLARSRLEDALLILEGLQAEQAELNAARERIERRDCGKAASGRCARQDAARQMTAIETLRARVAASEQALDRLVKRSGNSCAPGKRVGWSAPPIPTRPWPPPRTIWRAGWKQRLALEIELRDLPAKLWRPRTPNWKAGEQARSRCERRAETQRRVIEEQRLALSEARVRQQNLREQLQRTRQRAGSGAFPVCRRGGRKRTGWRGWSRWSGVFSAWGRSIWRPSRNAPSCRSASGIWTRKTTICWKR
jgi:chromosome segregation protein